MVYCSVCNMVYPPGTRYCIRCKTHLSFLPSDSSSETQVKCPFCGEMTSIESGKCQFCDKPLSAEFLDLSQPVPLHESLPETPPEKPQKKRKRTSRSSAARKSKTPSIETLKCPKCGNAVLTDFEHCPHCGSKLQTANSSKAQDATADVSPDKETQNTIQESKSLSYSQENQKFVEEEIAWETMECPSCHKTTRIDTGRCRHCNASLKPEPAEINESPVPEKSLETDAVPEPANPSPPETVKNIPPSTPAPAVPVVPSVATINSEQPTIKPVTQDIRQSHTSPVWSFIIVIGLVGVIALAGILVATYLLSHSSNSTKPVQVLSQPKELAAPTSSVSPVSTDSVAILQVLNNVRQAMLSKDSTLYFSSFSPHAPDLEQKQKVLETLWKTYQIQDLSYEISTDNPLTINDNQADIVVTWKMNLKSLSNNQIISTDQNNYVHFEKQNGIWKIAEVSAR